MTYSHHLTKGLKMEETMKKLFNNWRLAFLITLIATTQSFPEHPVVTEYVQVALQNNNLILEEKQKVAASKSKYKQSLGNYLPSLTLQSRYSRSEGGRSFPFLLVTLLIQYIKLLTFLMKVC